MANIEKSDNKAHPATQLWTAPNSGLLARIQAAMAQRGAHPHRTVVLLPYAHLLPLATRLWAQTYRTGFSPQFETTLNWSKRIGGYAPGPTDMAFDPAVDLLTAGALLQTAGLGEQQESLAGVLVDAARQLAPLAAAQPPNQRADWVCQARAAVQIGMDSTVLRVESSLAHIAVVWAAQSAYASDVVFSEQALASLDCLVVVRGFAKDPMIPALEATWGERLACLEVLPETFLESAWHSPHSQIAWAACWDAEDEAQRSAACVIAHIAAARIPLALVCTDRALTRRIRTMLESANVQIRDETGWKLSTSHAGAQLMALLKATVWNASSDAVLAWLKAAPAFAASVPDLEAVLRKDQTAQWPGTARTNTFKKSPNASALHAQVQQVRSAFQGKFTLAAWLEVLRGALQTSGMWDGLVADGAGAQVLAQLRLQQPTAPEWEELVAQALWAQQRMDASEFTHWVNQTLESANFLPTYPLHEQVVILPMSQMLARPFPAVVLAGCDEVRLPPAPEPPGSWTAAQREALGLPTREDLQQAGVAAWLHTLQTPFCDVLWRTSDDTGEALLPSALVQRVQLARSDTRRAVDPRTSHTVRGTPSARPLPLGDALPVETLSASSYQDLRTCPYKFFALRQLGLKSVDELEEGIDKRDFGNWLHDVLQHFHEDLQSRKPTSPTQRRELLDAAATHTTQKMGLGEGEFLPFAAAWPAVRDGYLQWMARHEATGAMFLRAESDHLVSAGTVKLTGRIDRTDALSDGCPMVLDYKTENIGKTKERIKEPLEDTQMAFYAALLPDERLKAAYINIGENGTETCAQDHILAARDALLKGIAEDMAAIAQATPLPALGDGAACEYCQVRGLCRKDFWGEP